MSNIRIKCCANCEHVVSCGDYVGIPEDVCEQWEPWNKNTCYADEVTHRNCKYSVDRGWVENACRNHAKRWNGKVGIEAYSFVCSKCGYNEPKKDVDNTLCLSIFDVKYCRNCGAKVVSE